MNIHEITKRCDHTLLKPDASRREIFELCDEAVIYGCASACIPPSYVAEARAYAGERLTICTVIGFPNGYMSTSAKIFEARDAISSGADELDVVINLGHVRDRRWGDIADEIAGLRRVCDFAVLKVIIETCMLDEDEKIRMCGIVSASGADFIKTSTGFGSAGATGSDIVLLRKHCAAQVKIKASGGISSLDDAVHFISLGADRLGSSRIIKLARETGMTPTQPDTFPPR